MEQLTAAQSRLLGQWDDCKKQLTAAKIELDRLKDVELDLRIQVAHSGITTQAEGVNKAAIGGGYVLSNTIKYTYKINNENKRELDKALSRLPDDVSDRLVTWKPTLSLTEYRRLNDRHKAIADSFITTTEAAPAVEIKEPKGA